MTDVPFAQFRAKVRSAADLAAWSSSGIERVVMCHGVFDGVHPGHIRHLSYARSLGDVLIVSITADRHIAKGIHRPHIPQDLRAINLAALSIVDYVIIDENPTPIANIQLLRPAVFAKGFEYNGMADATKTDEERLAVQAYGGQFVFTPGDIVDSSSRIIREAPPKIGVEKLLMVMDRFQTSFERLRARVASFGATQVDVVGDLIVDSYTRCAMIGGQTKTPTMSVHFERRDDFVGGAGIVAKHLAAAGASVWFQTVLGEDELGEFALRDLRAAGVTVEPFYDGRPTTQKNAITVGDYRLLKVDTLDNRPISDEVVAGMRSNLDRPGSHAVVFADFRHGIFNKRTIPRLVDAIPLSALKVGDSQVASRWGNITDFRGFDLITPNEREARFALGDQDSGIRPLASQLYDAAACRLLILKLGERGVMVCQDPHHEDSDSFFSIDSFADHVVDPVGAGDALLAYSTLSLIRSSNYAEAAILGVLAASVECELDGNVPVTPAQVTAKIDTLEGLAR